MAGQEAFNHARQRRVCFRWTTSASASRCVPTWRSAETVWAPKWACTLCSGLCSAALSQSCAAAFCEGSTPSMPQITPCPALYQLALSHPSGATAGQRATVKLSPKGSERAHRVLSCTVTAPPRIPRPAKPAADQGAVPGVPEATWAGHRGLPRHGQGIPEVPHGPVRGAPVAQFARGPVHSGPCSPAP